jgi:hypothetical protein
LSIDIADGYGAALRLLLASAERLSESAIRRGFLCLKILGLRSSALLRRVTPPDHHRPLERDFISGSLFEKLHFAFVTFCRRQRRKRSKISSLSRLGISVA